MDMHDNDHPYLTLQYRFDLTLSFPLHNLMVLSSVQLTRACKFSSTWSVFFITFLYLQVNVFVSASTSIWCHSNLPSFCLAVYPPISICLLNTVAAVTDIPQTFDTSTSVDSINAQFRILMVRDTLILSMLSFVFLWSETLIQPLCNQWGRGIDLIL